MPMLIKKKASVFYLILNCSYIADLENKGSDLVSGKTGCSRRLFGMVLRKTLVQKKFDTFPKTFSHLYVERISRSMCIRTLLTKSCKSKCERKWTAPTTKFVIENWPLSTCANWWLFDSIRIGFDYYYICKFVCCFCSVVTKVNVFAYICTC